MAATRKMTVEFYRVMLMHSNGKTLDHFLELTMGMSGSARNTNRDGNYIRLQEGSPHSDYWLGDMIKIRMQHLPMKADLNGQVSSLDLEKTEGLGDETAFLYHIPTKVLAIQRNRNAVTASAMAYYFSQRAGVDVELEIILEEAAIKKLDKMDSIRSFEIQIAALDHLSILKKQGQSVESMLRLSQYHQAPHIKMSVSMGRHKGTLEQVRDTAKRLLKLSAFQDRVVEKIRITGRHGDEDKTLLDLLEHRMLEHIELDSDGPARFVNFENRRTALKQAWVNRRSEILRMLKDA